MDTHDYSTYVKLKVNTSLAYTVGGWPGSDKWNPPGVMSNSVCYLVPSGRTLTTNTNTGSDKNTGEPYPAGGTWPCQELAVEGTFNIQATGGRTKAAVVPNFALLPGGKIILHSAYSTARGSTLDVRGTLANPSLIHCDYTNAENKAAYYPRLEYAFTGDADSAVKFEYTKTNAVNYSDFQRAFRVTGGFDDFLGTVIVDGNRTWLRPETSATTFDIGGTLWITNGASVYVATVSPTFGSLVMAGDATLQIVSGKSVTITDSLRIEEGARIVVDGVSAFKTDYDTGAGFSPITIDVLSVCGAANAAAVDRTALLDALKVEAEQYLHEGGVPRLKLVEVPREDGGVDFKLSHDPFVLQTKGCASGTGPYGCGQYDEFLSDKQEISPLKDYCTDNMNIYFGSSPYTFPGRSWTVYMTTIRTFGFYSAQHMTVPDLRLIGTDTATARFRQMGKDFNTYLYGNATIFGCINFRVCGSNRFWLYSNLSGSGDIAVTLDAAKILEKGGGWCGTLDVRGTNTAYTGRFLVGCGRGALDTGEDLTNVTLRASAGMHLGGAMESFTFDGVKKSEDCTLLIADTATFDAANRDWCLMDGSTVNISADKTATVNETVTFGGASVKTGAGTLVFGGSAKFYDDENDAAIDTPNGASFRIAAGGLGVTSAAALQGVGLTFAAGTKLVAYPDTDGLALSSAPTFEGGTLPVEIVVPDSDSFSSGTVNLLTLPSSVPFDAASLSVSRPKGCRLGAVTAKTVGDSTVYCATISKAALIVVIQ